MSSVIVWEEIVPEFKFSAYKHDNFRINPSYESGANLQNKNVTVSVGLLCGAQGCDLAVACVLAQVLFDCFAPGRVVATVSAEIFERLVKYTTQLICYVYVEIYRYIYVTHVISSLQSY